MRNNSEDETIKRNYLQKYKFLIKDYELVKEKRHPQFRLAQEFYKFHDTDRRSFRKYYNRYKLSGRDEDLLPQKRGPRWKTRRCPSEIEELVKGLRSKGMNRFEIVHVLKPQLQDLTPSPSCVYKILARHNLNRLRPAMKEERRQIIKEKAGELGHIDCHYLSKSLIMGESKRRYLLCVIDSCTRVAWAEVIDDIKSLTVMFAALKCFNIIADTFNIKFKEILSDNGPEFGTKESKSKAEHPFERLLMQLGMTHRYIRPYRPQTNGKVERFWKTIREDLIEETTFDSTQHFNDELIQYLAYYNYKRPHQALKGLTPEDFNKNCPRIT